MVGLAVLLASGALVLPGGAAAVNGASGAATRVPRGFVGMNGDGPLFNNHVELSGQLSNMVASGVQHLRVDFVWAAAQPYATWSQVPSSQRRNFVSGPGGVPTDYRATDQIVTQAAKRHLPLLPIVMYAPVWDASPKGSHIQPAHDGPYARFMTALVKRYGRHGTFWSDHRTLPSDPIEQWQIWNEPNVSYAWDTQPNFAPSYVKLLRVAHDAVKHADPGAIIALAALTNYGWQALASIYKVPGSRHLFDAVTADVYTAKPQGVITILGYYRQVMAQNGDRQMPIVATEVGWPSNRTSSRNPSFNTTEKGQAMKLAQLLPLLAEDRGRLRLAGFYFYTWMTTDRGRWIHFFGLRQYDPATHRISAKPAYWAFRRTVRKLES
jgi:hypothetical protein